MENNSKSITQSLGRNVDAAAAAVTRDPARTEFEFWCEFFLAGALDHPGGLRLPALVQNTGPARPAHVCVHPAAADALPCVEVIEVLGAGVERRFTIDSVRHIKFINQPHVYDTDVEGSCSCCRFFLKKRQQNPPARQTPRVSGCQHQQRIQCVDATFCIGAVAAAFS
jgi:hypothetical protein